MPRSFTANFLTQAAAKSSAPYQVLQVDWGGLTGTRYYLDRDEAEFSAAGQRVPALIDQSRVLDWGQTALDLKEQQIGAIDSRAVRLFDQGGELRQILESESRQHKPAKIWRLFDHASTVWPTDAALMFEGRLAPFGWQIESNSVTLVIHDASGGMLKHIHYPASKSIFPQVAEPYKDRSLPIVFGRARRVEAIPVQTPWHTRTKGFAVSGAGLAATPCANCLPLTTPKAFKVVITGVTNNGCIFCESVLNRTEDIVPQLTAPGVYLSAGACNFEIHYPANDPSRLLCNGGTPGTDASYYRGIYVQIINNRFEATFVCSGVGGPSSAISFAIYRLTRPVNPASCEVVNLELPFISTSGVKINTARCGLAASKIVLTALY